MWSCGPKEVEKGESFPVVDWIPGCDLFSAAFMTMAIILLHMFWGVVFFDACEKQRWWCVVVVVGSHLLVSCLVGGLGELLVAW